MVGHLSRVLVVDDEPEMRTLVGSVLSRRGLNVDYAEEGGAAINLIRENEYAVVLLDLLMPGINGFAVLESLNREATSSQPVVLVITGADRSVVDTLDPHRIHGIVKKPFDPEELAALVMTCADIKSRGPLGTMAIATMLGSSIFELLNRFAR